MKPTTLLLPLFTVSIQCLLAVRAIKPHSNDSSSHNASVHTVPVATSAMAQCHTLLSHEVDKLWGLVKQAHKLKMGSLPKHASNQSTDAHNRVPRYKLAKNALHRVERLRARLTLHLTVKQFIAVVKTLPTLCPFQGKEPCSGFHNHVHRLLKGPLLPCAKLAFGHFPSHPATQPNKPHQTKLAKPRHSVKPPAHKPASTTKHSPVPPPKLSAAARRSVASVLTNKQQLAPPTLTPRSLAAKAGTKPSGKTKKPWEKSEWSWDYRNWRWDWWVLYLLGVTVWCGFVAAYK